MASLQKPQKKFTQNWKKERKKVYLPPEFETDKSFLVSTIFLGSFITFFTDFAQILDLYLISRKKPLRNELVTGPKIACLTQFLNFITRSYVHKIIFFVNLLSYFVVSYFEPFSRTSSSKGQTSLFLANFLNIISRS